MVTRVSLAVLFGLAVVVLAALGVIEASAREAAETGRCRRVVTATPERWAACKAVCGEGAALLPSGDGSCLVVCACLPPGTTIEVEAR